MSFIITVYTSEGIVMVSDSRSTGSSVQRLPDGSTQTLLGTQITDTTYKTFKCNERIGLSTCGSSSIGRNTITGYIEKFISEKMTDDITVERLSDELLAYFSSLPPGLQTNFMVAGYNQNNNTPIVKRVYIDTGNIRTPDTSTSGACWDGEISTFSKLMIPVYSQNDDGTYSPFVSYGINFDFFTLQDAINFAQYAVDVTIKTMAFENCVKTVGGPVDILVIKPTESFWVARKELHA